MKEFAFTSTHDRTISVVLPIEAPEVLAVGEQLQAQHEAAYMNGYNWAALLDHYLARHHPNLLAEQETDPEGGTYVAYYPASPANQQKAARLATLLNELLANPEQLIRFVQAEGDNVEWD